MNKYTIRSRQRASLEKGFHWNMIEPIDWLSETMFSILIFLTFTLAFRIIRISGSQASPDSYYDINELLVGVLGAVLAWGIIDGIMYVVLSMFERGERHRLLREIQAAETEAAALEVIADDMDYLLEPITGEAERNALYGNILFHLKNSQPRKIGLKSEDFIYALGHVLVAILAVIPSVIPLYLLQNNSELAIWVSILMSFIVLFIAGYGWGRYTGVNPWKTGFLLMAIAVTLVLVAIPLGG